MLLFQSSVYHGLSFLGKKANNILFPGLKSEPSVFKALPPRLIHLIFYLHICLSTGPRAQVRVALRHITWPFFFVCNQLPIMLLQYNLVFSQKDAPVNALCMHTTQQNIFPIVCPFPFLLHLQNQTPNNTWRFLLCPLIMNPFVSYRDEMVYAIGI